MSLLGIVVSVLLAQSPPAQAAAEAPNCLAAANEGIAAFCAGEDFLRQSSAAREAAERDALMRRAADAFRRSASVAKDFDVKKLALSRLESVYDADHLDQPREIEPILRELIAVSADDYGPLFKLASLQESQGFFDAAESTLLAAHQQRADDPEPVRELAKFFSRRADALSGHANLSTTKTHIDPDAPDEKGVYSPGGSIPPPESTSSGAVDVPAEARAAGVTGTVMCEIVIDEKGRVSDAKVTQSVPMLDEAALTAVRTWRFTPSVLNGRAVPVRLQVQVNFQ
jgi:TonB family protein